VIALACYGFESLRRDKFLQGAGGIDPQPPAIAPTPAPARTEQSQSPGGPPTSRQRALS
jgi:hypothetical protein